MSSVTPYENSDGTKKEQIAEMFDNIAHKYDFLNHFFSLGIDKLWRKKAIRLLSKAKRNRILDIATGTGDFAFEALKLNPEKVIGIDISKGMLDKGNDKVSNRKLNDKIDLILGDSENLDFEDNSFDAITVGFGVRNFENLEKGLKEINRVIKPDGKVAILELSLPDKFPLKQLYNFHFNHIMPLIGRIMSKDSKAYTYLHESVAAFPSGPKFVKVLENCGFTQTEIHKVSGGIASIYLTGKN